MSIHPNTPVLIGVGQTVDHWSGEDAAQAPSPVGLAAAAARAALADAGGDTGAGAPLAGAIDRVVFVRTMLDSVAGLKPPFPQCANPPGALCADLGLHPAQAIYSEVGGDQPQTLVNEAAEAIFAGEAQAVLIAGAEATAAVKTAARARLKLDWSREVAAPMIDRGLGPPLLSPYEMANGLGAPTQTYPAFEHALRARMGFDRDAWRGLMSELWAGFSQVAAANPYAQFPTARTAEFLATESAENYAVADPYLKWHVAQDAVNQGAAAVLTSVARAQALGVAADRMLFLHGYAKGRDRPPTERADLSRSRAIELVLKRALESAKVGAGDLAEIDLYSCFPCAVFLAAEALGIDRRSRPLTVTGGLPFFGGPGNNYSLHAIATMAERLRAAPGAYGLVLANGGFLSKEAAGVYSTTPVENWAPVSSADLQAELDAQTAPALSESVGPATVETYTVTWRKGAAQRGYVIGKQADGRRVLARPRTGHRATLAALAASDPVGTTVEIERGDGVNLIAPADRLGEAVSESRAGRAFRYVSLERRGHVLEVTLNRPDAMNALHGPAHFELHEVWDGFEADPDLWVAIVTGAGERAFCSGNDLKASARGGDVTPAASGFGGLCSRFDREKPIIAAVNGVAMGGGLEIVLACDLAVAEEHARMALPEVKVGLFAAAGGVQRLTRQIGRKAANELILTGRHIDAAEALSLGIVNRVVPKGGALAAARELAETITGNSPSSIRASKQALNKLEQVEDLKTALEANGPIIGHLMRTRDMREGVTAFAEKRAPRWTNS